MEIYFDKYLSIISDDVNFRLKAQGLNPVCCIDTIRTNYYNDVPLNQAKEEAYWDTMYWEGHLD